MQARTPLSTFARPYIPGATCTRRPAVLVLPSMFPMDSIYGEAAFASCAQQGQAVHQDTTQNYSRGRSNGGATKLPSRMPSRTPSPSGSICVSEASTIVASWMSKEDSLSDVSAPDCIKEPCEIDTVPIKKTFVHFDDEGTSDEPNKLSRSHSAPAALWSAALSAEKPSALAHLQTTSVMSQLQNLSTMAQLHKQGDCRPCAYFTTKADGCRAGSDCAFCHLCPPDELKNRKKLRMKARKETMLDNRYKKKSAFQPVGLW